MALITIVNNGPIHSIVEDSDYLWINNLAHTKSNLTPVFGTWLGVVGAVSYTFNLRKTLYITAGTTVQSTAQRDSTLHNPVSIGYTYPLFTSSEAGARFFFDAELSSWLLSATTYVYQKMDNTNKYVGRFSAGANAYENVIPVCTSSDGTFILSVGQRYDTAPTGVISKWPTNTPAGATNIVTGAYAYGSVLMSENASYYFIGVVTSASGTNPTVLAIYAISKTTLASTTVLTPTTFGTSYPPTYMSNAYSASADSKYTYAVVSNATDPVYTIKYVNYNQASLTQTNGNCTIDWGGSSSSAEFGPSVRTTNWPILRSWVVTTGTASYMYFALMENGGSQTETTANMKLYGFTISSGTPSSLTHKETIAIGSTHGFIKSVTPIADDWSRIMVVTASNIHIYDFSDANGYTLGTTIPHNSVGTGQSDIGAIGVDGLGRIWVQSSGGLGSQVHMYSASTATTITLTFASSSYNYSGTTITSSFNLSAYNASGSRIATSVQVVFDSPNCTFSDDTTTKTITTSSGGETSTNIKITGPGLIRAVANVAV